MAFGKQLLLHYTVRASIVLAAIGLKRLLARRRRRPAKEVEDKGRGFKVWKPQQFTPSPPWWIKAAAEHDPSTISLAGSCPQLQDFKEKVSTGKLNIQPGMQARQQLFSLDPAVTHLNHGSYGAAFRLVLQVRQWFEAHLEAQPSEFMEHSAVLGIAAAAAEVARALGCNWQDVVPVRNATSGMAAVLRSLKLRAGDSMLITSLTYPAVRNLVARVAKDARAKVIEVTLGLREVLDGKFLVSAFQDALAAGRGRVRVAVLDHVCSFPPVVLPVQQLAELCREAGAKVLIDGAHGLGAVRQLQVPHLGADFYVTNLHKWLCTCKGTAVLWVRPELQPLILPNTTSHGAGLGFRAEFLWQGTLDPTPWMSVPAALAVMDAYGLDAVVRRNHSLLREAVELLLAVWGRHLPVIGLHLPPIPAGWQPPATRHSSSGPDSGSPANEVGRIPLQSGCGSMAAIKLPALRGFPASVDSAVRLRMHLRQHHHIEVPVGCWEGALWVRLSAQLYNTPQDYQHLASVVDGLRRSGSVSQAPAVDV